MAAPSKFAALCSLLSLTTITHGQNTGGTINAFLSEKFKDPAEVLAIPLKRVDRSELPGASTSIQRRYFKTDVVDFFGSAYLAKITVGTGASNQEVQVLLDTGSFELWVNPNCTASNLPSYCQQFGSYDPKKSSTAQNLTTPWSITYGSGSAQGIYFTDDIFISGAQIKQQQFGLARNSQSVWFGIMGLGYGKMAQGKPGFLPYNTVVDTLVAQNYTNSKAFSLDLGLQAEPEMSISGQIVFGGVDTNRYSGTLAKVPIDNEDAHYKVTLSAVAHRSPSSQSANIVSAGPIDVIVDSGTTFSLLPQALVNALAAQFPGATSDGGGGYKVPCSYLTLPGAVDFSFGRVKISVPYSEFIWNNGNNCFLGAWYNQNINVYILGDTFLRGAYTIFDQDNSALYMANYTTCGTGSNLVAIPAGMDAAASLQGSCQIPQTSTVSSSSLTTGTPPTTVTSAGSTFTGPTFTGDPNPLGPANATTSEMDKPTSTGSDVVPTPTLDTTSGTVSVTSSSELPRVTSIADGPIFLGVLLDGGAAKNNTKRDFPPSRSRSSKRQTTGGFIGGAGPTNPESCSDATSFNLTDGQLVSGGQAVRTDPAVAFMPLQVQPSGSISTTFAVVDGVLHWFNDAFYQGEAGFCQTADGEIQLTFVSEAGWPAGCTAVSLAVYEDRQCQDGTLVLAPTTASAATSTATPTGAPDGFTTVPVTRTNTITSTITNVVVYTVTACPPEVANCPIGQLATTTSVYVTTICPEDALPTTPGPSPSPPPPPQPTSGPAVPPNAAPADGGAAVAVVSVVTVTEECETATFAVTTCAPGAAGCTVGALTTQTTTRYRTITQTTPQETGAGGVPPVAQNAPGSGPGVQMGAGYNNSADATATPRPVYAYAGAPAVEARAWGLVLGALLGALVLTL
ncbi:uncharacterized protein JN550_000711 [Neoarthrinium moseri]|uniref:uncharacterized protein n=1 Tax=Neoarthrinium moseri TaxID=1658444 RepID=UPI001FDB9579|nr:uncharacterized protein JN550_000711 [Neoarthrinium moseri]KAI1878529.1 hypothetical protein JN550_000711 [Neoarthrinium moseri]